MPLKQELGKLKGLIVTAAQKVYDEWEIDEEGFDDEYGGGGICDAIANEISSIIASNTNAYTTVGGQDGDDHAWIIAYTDDEQYGIDIDPRVYENGGGYSWKKKEDVRITQSDVEIFPVDKEAIDNPSVRKNMYSKSSVASYARERSPKRSYKRNLVLPIGASSLAKSLLGGEVMKRAKEWRKGKRSKLARKLTKNPSEYGSLRVVKHEKLESPISCYCCGRSIAKAAILENGDKVGSECEGLIEFPSYRYGRKLTTKQKAYFDNNGLSMPKRNPEKLGDVSPEVEDLSKKWHGREVEGYTEIEETESYDDDLVDVGDLMELGVWAIDGGMFLITFKKDRPKLTSDGEGHNLEIVGGDQDLDLEGEGIQHRGKTLIPIGHLYSIVYETDKHHLEGSSGYPEPYEHYFAEEFYKKKLDPEKYGDDTEKWFADLMGMGIVEKAKDEGRLPMAIYNKTDGKILISGGGYEVTEEGIRD